MMDLFWKTEVGSDETEKLNSPNIHQNNIPQLVSRSLNKYRRVKVILQTDGQQKSLFPHRVRHAFDKSVQSSKVRKIMMAEAVSMFCNVTH